MVKILEINWYPKYQDSRRLAFLLKVSILGENRISRNDILQFIWNSPKNILHVIVVIFVLSFILPQNDHLGKLRQIRGFRCEIATCIGCKQYQFDGL